MKTISLTMIALLWLLNSKAQSSDVVVLFDVSNSVNEKRDYNEKLDSFFLNCIDMCSKLIFTYPPGSTISYHIISSNYNSGKLGTVKIPIFTKNKESGQIALLQQQAGKVKQILEAQARHPEANTCILTSIEKAYYLLTNGTMGHKRELVIFSDMIEECGISSMGSIFMKKDNKELLSKQEFTIINNYTSNINLGANLIMVKIKNTSPKIGIQKFKQIEEAWRLIFSKYEYTVGRNIQLINSCPENKYLTLYEKYIKL